MTLPGQRCHSTMLRASSTNAVRSIDFKPAHNEIRSRTRPRTAVRGACSLTPRYPHQTYLSHQPGHALTTDVHPVGGEFGVNTRRSISTTAALIDIPNAGLEDSIVLLARRQLTVSPDVVPARGDTKQSGHFDDGQANLIRSHELECLLGSESISRANQAMAFASISRSRHTRRRLTRHYGNPLKEGLGIHESGSTPGHLIVPKRGLLSLPLVSTPEDRLCRVSAGTPKACPGLDPGPWGIQVLGAPVLGRGSTGRHPGAVCQSGTSPRLDFVQNEGVSRGIGPVL